MLANKPNLTLNPEISTLVEDIKDKFIVVFSGTNNSGKSFLLKKLYKEYGTDSYYLGCQRFLTIDRINPYNEDSNYKTDSFRNFTHIFENGNGNNDNSSMDFSRSIFGLTNTKRTLLLNILSELIGEPFTIKDFDSNNECSGKYIDVNGYNSSYASTGTRFLMVILATILDETSKRVLIDEPELGLAPSVQSILAEFIYNPTNKEEYFSHLDQIIISSHSNIFLNRQNITSNYIIRKENNVISTTVVESITEFNKLQFNLLGNTFETLFLPSLFILVEGPSDELFINKVLLTKFPNNNFVIVCCIGDDGVREKTKLLKQMMGNFDKNPYKTRIFPILDSVNQPNSRGFLLNEGLPEEQIIIRNKNGIEYYYPEDILKEIFSYSGNDIIDRLEIDGTSVSLNGITKKKTELANMVVEKINDTSTYNSEFNDKFLSKISEVIN